MDIGQTKAQGEKEVGKNMQSSNNQQNSIKWSNIHVEFQKDRREKMKQKKLNNHWFFSPNLIKKKINSQIQESPWIQSSKSIKKTTQKHILKLLEPKDGEKLLKAASKRGCGGCTQENNKNGN